MATLYIVSTPIGNLQDITLRAIETLKRVDFIACEDTRETRKLLTHFGIKAKPISYHEHNKGTRTPQIIKRLLSGEECALVSDRGTPTISDPGFFLVRAVVENGITVVPIPGSSAILASLVVSALPTDRFLFVGFLPKKKGLRQTLIREVRDTKATLVMYTSPHIVNDAVAEMIEILGDRHGVIVREVTKINEEIVRGKLSDLLSVISEREEKPPGELVLLIEGASKKVGTSPGETDHILHALYSLPPTTMKDGVTWLIEHVGVRKNRAYEIVQEFLSNRKRETETGKNQSGK